VKSEVDAGDGPDNFPAMRLVRAVILLVGFLSGAFAAAGEPAAILPDRVVVPTISTSIYVGSVTLTTTPFVREGDTYSATYEAKVFPWIFWNENGRISLTVPAAEIARLRNGEQIEFAGEAENHRGKPRPVTGRARPESPTEGSIKVRINADGIELIFNGRYRFEDPAQPVAAATPPAAGE